MQLSESEDNRLPDAFLPFCLTFQVRSPALWQPAKYSSLSPALSMQLKQYTWEAL